MPCKTSVYSPTLPPLPSPTKRSSSLECKVLECGLGFSPSAQVPGYIECLPDGKRPPAGLSLERIIGAELGQVVSLLALGSAQILVGFKRDRVKLIVEVRPLAVLPS